MNKILIYGFQWRQTIALPIYTVLPYCVIYINITFFKMISMPVIFICYCAVLMDSTNSWSHCNRWHIIPLSLSCLCCRYRYYRGRATGQNVQLFNLCSNNLFLSSVMQLGRHCVGCIAWLVVEHISLKQLMWVQILANTYVESCFKN